MSGFTAIELDKLPAPDAVEPLDFETILADARAQLIGLDPSLADVLALESEPINKLLEVFTYRELLLRQRVNEAVKAVMLPYAMDADLDNLGALFGVQRLQLDAGDPDAIPPVPARYETNSDFRRRIQLSLEGLSTAGPEGAYVFHGLSADGDVLDISATSPSPGDVLVTVLSRTGDGAANQALQDTVAAALSADNVRPLTDNVTVQSATIINYSIDATLFFFSGPDRALVLAEAQSNIDAYVAKQHKLGLDITLSGIYSALHVPGVQRVNLASPGANISVNRQSTAYCTNITLTDGGLDE
ncbi:baseplate assembly protein [Motiliproteus sp.]|uniref:baseplate assembly protein n=1 Tax=Motiliproteus sp. TaxID=1898955 RepID=UPI003BA8F65C